MHRIRPVVLSLVLIACALGSATATAEETAPRAAAARAVDTYASLPKGVTLEGRARGFEPVKYLQYDRASNSFLVNKDTTYPNPVDRDEMTRLLRALAEDDRLGVSVIFNREELVFGALRRRGEIARALVNADILLTSVVFGWNHRLERVDLPGDYVPKSPGRRTVDTVCYHNFHDYTFERRGDAYARTDFTLTTMLIPMSRERSSDGGYLPDWQRLDSGELEPTDKENLAHLRAHLDEYLAMPRVEKVVRLGEAAAFVRLIRDAQFDLNAIADAME
jgi:hypothetical protein